MSPSRWHGLWDLVAASDAGAFLVAGLLIGAVLTALLGRRWTRTLLIIGGVLLLPAPLALIEQDARIPAFNDAGFIVGMLYFAFGVVGFPAGWLIGVAVGIGVQRSVASTRG